MSCSTRNTKIKIAYLYISSDTNQPRKVSSSLIDSNFDFLYTARAQRRTHLSICTSSDLFAVPHMIEQ